MSEHSAAGPVDVAGAVDKRAWLGFAEKRGQTRQRQYHLQLRRKKVSETLTALTGPASARARCRVSLRRENRGLARCSLPYPFRLRPFLSLVPLVQAWLPPCAAFCPGLHDPANPESRSQTTSGTPTAPATPALAPEKAAGSSTQGLKSFLSGGFGGVASVLVGASDRQLRAVGNSTLTPGCPRPQASRST